MNDSIQILLYITSIIKGKTLW